MAFGIDVATASDTSDHDHFDADPTSDPFLESCDHQQNHSSSTTQLLLWPSVSYLHELVHLANDYAGISRPDVKGSDD